MSFGTTDRARTCNESPLRRRFVAALHEPRGATQASRIAEAELLEALAQVPGWDADGRPVEP